LVGFGKTDGKAFVGEHEAAGRAFIGRDFQEVFQPELIIGITRSRSQ
jgi:hypothetical protein